MLQNISVQNALKQTNRGVLGKRTDIAKKLGQLRKKKQDDPAETQRNATIKKINERIGEVEMRVGQATAKYNELMKLAADFKRTGKKVSALDTLARARAARAQILSLQKMAQVLNEQIYQIHLVVLQSNQVDSMRDTNESINNLIKKMPNVKEVVEDIDKTSFDVQELQTFLSVGTVGYSSQQDESCGGVTEEDLEKEYEALCDDQTRDEEEDIAKVVRNHYSDHSPVDSEYTLQRDHKQGRQREKESLLVGGNARGRQRVVQEVLAEEEELARLEVSMQV